LRGTNPADARRSATLYLPLQPDLDERLIRHIARTSIRPVSVRHRDSENDCRTAEALSRLLIFLMSQGAYSSWQSDPTRDRVRLASSPPGERLSAIATLDDQNGEGHRVAQANYTKLLRLEELAEVRVAAVMIKRSFLGSVDCLLGSTPLSITATITPAPGPGTDLHLSGANDPSPGFSCPRRVWRANLRRSYTG
jgi:hypothetical protein